MTVGSKCHQGCISISPNMANVLVTLRFGALVNISTYERAYFWEASYGGRSESMLYNIDWSVGSHHQMLREYFGIDYRRATSRPSGQGKTMSAEVEALGGLCSSDYLHLITPCFSIAKVPLMELMRCSGSSIDLYWGRCVFLKRSCLILFPTATARFRNIV